MRTLTITFNEDGTDKISDYSGSHYTTDEIITMLHNSSYRKNLVKRLRELTNNKNLEELSEVSLGYALEELMKSKIYSTVSKIEFHNKPLSNFGVKYKS